MPPIMSKIVISWADITAHPADQPKLLEPFAAMTILYKCLIDWVLQLWWVPMEARQASVVIIFTVIE